MRLGERGTPRWRVEYRPTVKGATPQVSELMPWRSAHTHAATLNGRVRFWPRWGWVRALACIWGGCIPHARMRGKRRDVARCRRCGSIMHLPSTWGQRPATTTREAMKQQST